MLDARVLRRASGSLAAARSVLWMNVYVQCAEDFTEHSEVSDAASGLLLFATLGTPEPQPGVSIAEERHRRKIDLVAVAQRCDEEGPAVRSSALRAALTRHRDGSLGWPSTGRNEHRPESRLWRFNLGFGAGFSRGGVHGLALAPGWLSCRFQCRVTACLLRGAILRSVDAWSLLHRSSRP